MIDREQIITKLAAIYSPKSIGKVVGAIGDVGANLFSRKATNQVIKNIGNPEASLLKPRSWLGEIKDFGKPGWWSTQKFLLGHHVDETGKVFKRSLIGKYIGAPLLMSAPVSAAVWAGADMASGDSPGKAIAKNAPWVVAPTAMGAYSLGQLGFDMLKNKKNNQNLNNGEYNALH